MPRKKLPSGSLPLIFASAVFIVSGIIMNIKPHNFLLSGGVGQHGSTSVGGAFSGESTQFIAWCFILIGAFIGYLAYGFIKSE